MLEEIMSEFEDKRISSLVGIEEGTMVSAVLIGYSVYLVEEAKVHWENGRAYLCQNVANGNTCNDRLGYEYVWNCISGSKEDLKRLGIRATIFEYGTDIVEAFKVIEEERRKEEERERIEAEKRAEEKKKRVLLNIENNKDKFVENVLKYVKFSKSTPLFFRGGDKLLDLNEDLEDEIKAATKAATGARKEYYDKLEGLDKLVYKAYILSRHYPSWSEKFHIETRFGAKRSSIDLWRHLLTVDPELSIFDVMDSMWRLSSDLDSGWGCTFCSGVKRMVFYFGGTMVHKHNLDRKDEYNNYLSNWKYAKELYEAYLEEQEKNEETN